MNDFYVPSEQLRRTTVAFTGHRTYKGEVDDELRCVVRELYAVGIRRFLCGMSWGFDLAAGECVAALKREHSDVVLVAVEPFATFRSLFSGVAAEQYDRVLAAADERIVVGDDERGAYMLRNDYLVDNSRLVVAWYNYSPRGGTAYTVKRAERNRVEVTNLYPQPQLEFEF